MDDITDDELLRNVANFERTAHQEGGALNREGYFEFNLTPFRAF